MKKIFSFLILLGIQFAGAQNLITNGSFENFSGNCPGSAPNGQFTQVLGWKPGNFSTALGFAPSVDLYCGGPNYGGCAPGPSSPSDSTAYVGFHTRVFSPPYNEDIYQELATPLITGDSYQISFDLMTCQSGLFTSGPSDFCVYFNIDTVIPGCPTDNPSVINVGCIPFDSISNTNWQNHSFQFVAPANANIIAFSGAACNVSEVYYYLDNVQLTQVKPTEIVDILNKDNATLGPNPFTNQLNFSSASREPVSVSLFDISGRLILEEEFTGQGNIDTTPLSGGMYFYEVKISKERIKAGRVLKK